MSARVEGLDRRAAPVDSVPPPAAALSAAVDGLAALLPAAGAHVEGRTATDALVQLLVAPSRLQAWRSRW